MAGSWTNERTGDVPTASYGSRATLVLMQALGFPVWVRYKKKSQRGCRLESVEWKRQANKGSKYHWARESWSFAVGVSKGDTCKIGVQKVS